MKKMIRFTVLLLLITGVFIFSSGEKVAAATDIYGEFTVYSFENGSDGTSHDLPLTLDFNDLIIFIDGNLIYSLGTTVDEAWSLRSNENAILIIDESQNIYDSIYFQSIAPFKIDDYIGVSIVIVVAHNPGSFNVWGFQSTDNTHEVSSSIILDNTYFYVDGKLINDDSDWLIASNIYSFINIESISLGDNISFDDTGLIYNNLEMSLVIIEYNPSEPEPDPEYTITFNTNGGSAVDPIVVTEGAMLYETIWNPPVETTRSGYTFDDWYKNAGLTIPVNESDTVTSDLTLYANWILNVVNYTVTFNTNGGSYIAPQSIVSGEQASRPTDPVKTGYTFNGWYTEMFFINLYNFNSAVSDNITLYAQWTLAEDPIEDEDDAWDVVVANLPWIILGLIFVAIIFKR